MKLLSSNGQTYSIQPLDYICSNNATANKSKGHLLARQLIKEIFVAEWILEEVPAKIGKQTLYVDFLLKSRQIVVEVQGIQHKEFTPHFHETQAGFRASQVRDQQKRLWCELNQFTLIELDSEQTDGWRNQLCNY